MGMNVFIVVGETDAQAQKLAERAYKVWHHSFHYLYHLHGRSPVHGAGDGFEDVERRGLGIAGSPQTVIDCLASRIAQSAPLSVGQFVFGDMKLAEFAPLHRAVFAHVMPRFEPHALSLWPDCHKGALLHAERPLWNNSDPSSLASP